MNFVSLLHTRAGAGKQKASFLLFFPDLPSLLQSCLDRGRAS